MKGTEKSFVHVLIAYGFGINETVCGPLSSPSPWLHQTGSVFPRELKFFDSFLFISFDFFKEVFNISIHIKINFWLFSTRLKLLLTTS